MLRMVFGVVGVKLNQGTVPPSYSFCLLYVRDPSRTDPLRLACIPELTTMHDRNVPVTIRGEHWDTDVTSSFVLLHILINNVVTL